MHAGEFLSCYRIIVYMYVSRRLIRTGEKQMDSDDACKKACIEGPGGFDGGHQMGDGCLCTKKGKKGKGKDN